MSPSFKYLIGIITTLAFSVAYAADYHYERHLKDTQIIHVVTFPANKFDAQLVKSNDGSAGRETVPAIAKRTQADIAINGGFFEIGGDRDGFPSGSLVIRGKRYKVKNTTQALLIINHHKPVITYGNPKNYLSEQVSLVSGIPLLIQQGKILTELHNKQSDFYVGKHARTALGETADGNIIIIVAEHGYKGLTILELAHFMKDLKCQTAINLDGGGSATLWIDGKVVNETVGDIDEKNGFNVVRPVSDAIIFKHKSAL